MVVMVVAVAEGAMIYRAEGAEGGRGGEGKRGRGENQSRAKTGETRDAGRASGRNIRE